MQTNYPKLHYLAFCEMKSPDAAFKDKLFEALQISIDALKTHI